MSIIPTKINLADDTVTLWHDNHGADISFSHDIMFLKDTLMGSEDIRYLTMVCPVCGDTVIHPVSGGAAPEEVQKLFVYKLRERYPDRTFEQAKVLARELVSAQDGLWRWQQENLEEGA